MNGAHKKVLASKLVNLKGGYVHVIFNTVLNIVVLISVILVTSAAIPDQNHHTIMY